MQSSCPGRSSNGISECRAGVFHRCPSKSFVIFLPSAILTHFKFLPLLTTLIGLPGIPLHLPMELATTLLSFSLLLYLSPFLLTSTSWPLCCLTSSPLRSFFLHLTTTPNSTATVEPLSKISSLSPPSFLLLAHQTLIPISRSLDFIKTTNLLTPTTFTILLPLTASLFCLPS